MAARMAPAPLLGFLEYANLLRTHALRARVSGPAAKLLRGMTASNARVVLCAASRRTEADGRRTITVRDLAL